MAKIAVLAPYPALCEQIRPLIGRYSHISPVTIEYVPQDEVEKRCVEFEMAGCEVILARGLYARIARRSVRLPVVELKVTAQELGVLIMDLRHLLGLECPRIGLIGFSNMMCDTSQFNSLFGIDLYHYMVDSWEELGRSVDRAIQDGCLAIVGGEVACNRARYLNLPHRFIHSSQESLTNALEIADGVCYAIDLEKSNRAEMDTMLDFTFSGIIQINREGIIQRANRMAFNLMGQTPQDLVGRPIQEVLPQLGADTLNHVLTEGGEVYACVLVIEKRDTVVNVAPIQIDGQIEGAILTFQEGRRIREMDQELRRDAHQRGYYARHTFESVPFRSQTMLSLLEQARRIARTEAPVLIVGEPGSGRGFLAQCIHNQSLNKESNYVPVDCQAYPSDTLDTLLFGNMTVRKDSPPCMAELARDGTLYLSHVESLSLELQNKLLQLVNGRFLHNGSSRPVSTNVRVISSSNVSLIPLVEDGTFRNDLYYTLSVLSLQMPPLRKQEEDILTWTDTFLQLYQEKYQRYISLTQGARRLLCEYEWPGNLDQLRSLCQRTVLMAEKRSVDEVFLKRQLEQMAPRILRDSGQVVIYRDPKAVQITEILQKYNGSRQKTAEELGISTTTLWRYMKKYGIDDSFNS